MSRRCRGPSHSGSRQWYHSRAASCRPGLLLGGHQPQDCQAELGFTRLEAGLRGGQRPASANTRKCATVSLNNAAPGTRGASSLASITLGYFGSDVIQCEPEQQILRHIQDTKVRSRRLHEPHGLEILERACSCDIPELSSRRLPVSV
jgi:hypothetical protein